MMSRAALACSRPRMHVPESKLWLTCSHAMCFAVVFIRIWSCTVESFAVIACGASHRWRDRALPATQKFCEGFCKIIRHPTHIVVQTQNDESESLRLCIVILGHVGRLRQVCAGYRGIRVGFLVRQPEWMMYGAPEPNLLQSPDPFIHGRPIKHYQCHRQAAPRTISESAYLT
jgi:hypothetical protein